MEMVKAEKLKRVIALNCSVTHYILDTFFDGFHGEKQGNTLNPQRCTPHITCLVVFKDFEIEDELPSLIRAATFSLKAHKFINA